MATDVYFQCTKCRRYSPAASMFAALRLVAESGVEPCPACGAGCKLHLDFNFATSTSGPHRCTVWKAFLPPGNKRLSRKPGGKTVEFFPFLVFLDQPEPYNRAVWLPYWHVKRSKSRQTILFGQWAPFMGQDLYTNLLAQARRAGCIK